MPTEISQLLHDIEPAHTLPLDTSKLWRRAKQRRRRRRAIAGAGTILAAGSLIGVAVTVGAHSKDREVNVASSQAQLNGSPGMPATFVGTTFDNGVYLLNSHTGAVITALLGPSDQPIDSVATSRHWVYLALYGTQPAVRRVPVNGGPAETIASANAFDLALSPDGSKLAWTEPDNPLSTQPLTPGSPNVVTVYNLETHSATRWTLDQVPHGQSNGYGIDGIAWATNTSLAVLSTSYNAEMNAQPGGNCSGSIGPGQCRADPIFDAYLTTIDVTSGPSAPIPTIGFNLPPIRIPPLDGDLGAHIFAAGDTPGTFIVTARDHTSDPVSTYKLTLTAKTVQVQVLHSFNGTEVPTAIDPDNRDTLLVKITSDGLTSYVARSTDSGPPIILNSTKPWASATW